MDGSVFHFLLPGVHAEWMGLYFISYFQVYMLDGWHCISFLTSRCTCWMDGTVFHFLLPGVHAGWMGLYFISYFQVYMLDGWDCISFLTSRCTCWMDGRLCTGMLDNGSVSSVYVFFSVSLCHPAGTAPPSGGISPPLTVNKRVLLPVADPAAQLRGGARNIKFMRPPSAPIFL